MLVELLPVIKGKIAVDGLILKERFFTPAPKKM
jgi:hypothetical protein